MVSTTCRKNLEFGMFMLSTLITNASDNIVKFFEEIPQALSALTSSFSAQN